MKIAYFINSMEGGGAQTPLPRIIEALERAGATVQLFALTRRNGKAIERLQANGVEPVVREGTERDHLSALRWMIAQARGSQADIIWTSLTRATLLGQLAGHNLNVPVVSWQHNAFLKPWNERLLAWRADASDLWVADSAQVARLTRDRLGIAPENLVTWPIFAADPDVAQARPWKPGQTLKLGSLGRLHPAKGYDVLIRALATVNEAMATKPPFSVTIGGIGAQEHELKRRAREAGVEINFAGFIEEPASFLSNLHLYLQPSRREGFCIAVHEAMQTGLPVIVSDTGEMPFTVNDNSIGIVVPVEDHEALAQALIALLGDPQSLSRMGRAARERVLNRFSTDQFNETAVAIVERLRTLVQMRAT